MGNTGDDADPFVRGSFPHADPRQRAGLVRDTPVCKGRSLRSPSTTTPRSSDDRRNTQRSAVVDPRAPTILTEPGVLEVSTRDLVANARVVDTTAVDNLQLSVEDEGVRVQITPKRFATAPSASFRYTLFASSQPEF
jgi:hypothetical protein